ncbi:MAG: hypothetical protein M9918_08030 [Anaerolineae bacterium]|nr:hypothetical protein [Anaerolineae bacterium]
MHTSQEPTWPGSSAPRYSAESLFDTISQPWQMDELAAEVNRERQARIALIGRSGVGKRTLYNRLRGGIIDWSARPEPPDTTPNVEPLGLFILVDMPKLTDAELQPLLHSPESLLAHMGDPTLLVYLLNAVHGVTQADYRWLAALRMTGRSLIVVMNKSDLAPASVATIAAQHLGMNVLTISAHSGDNIDNVLLPAMLQAAPQIAVPLANEIAALRHKAARRVIRQTALFTALLGAQPIPGLELPLLAITHIGLVMRIGAAYGHTPGGGIRRETVLTIGMVMALQYAAQTVIKMTPILGSVVSGLLSGLTTLIIGELAIRYYEADATLLVRAIRARLGRNKETN